jgi:hypothetical protein
MFLFCYKIIENHKIFSEVQANSAKDSRLAFYLQKSLIDGYIGTDIHAPARVLYLIHVVAQIKAENESEKVLVLIDRPWKLEYEEYARNLGVRLQWTGPGLGNKDFRAILKKIIRKSPFLFKTLNRIREGRISKIKLTSHNNLYVQGLGNYNLKADGKHSDFDWLNYSAFRRDRVLYFCPVPIGRDILADSGMLTVSNSVINSYVEKATTDLRVHELNGLSRVEKIKIRKILEEYIWECGKWKGFFQQNNIKVFMTWMKYSPTHAAMADAISTLGGISVVNQVAFDGFKNIECQTNVDVAFGFSNWSAIVERELGSVIPYFVIAGYPRDHARPTLEADSKKLRMRLQQAGARKIICVFDENSHEDIRWHTGHEFQQEHYRHVLERVLETPWLGAIFKPKTPSTLRNRLGPVNDLLVEAEKTGRCVVFEKRHYNKTVEPVLLAGLAADVAIHGHLSAGTAAIECALEGIPTLLINRENIDFSKLNELPQNTVVFKDWPSTIEAVMEHFSSEKGIPEFGIWDDEFLDQIDSFRDGKASYRIGTYLKWLIDGFDQGLNREIIMAEAADRYAEKWGHDKIISV